MSVSYKYEFLMNNHDKIVFEGFNRVILKDDDGQCWLYSFNDDNQVEKHQYQQRQCVDCEMWCDSCDLTENGHCQPCVKWS